VDEITMTMDAVGRRPSAKPFLDIDAIDLTYATKAGPILALKNFSMAANAGEFVAVIGPSGCGKSTLLKLVAGLITPSAGRISIDGRPVDGPRRETGLMFQAATLLPWKTVLNNVLVPIRAMRLKASDYRGRAMELLKLVGLEGFADNYPSELSGGMQQRVSLARAFIHDPQILLMDEPFAALDAMTREHMAAELQRLWMHARKSVIFITHHIPEAVFLSDRVIVVSARPGQVVNDIAIDLPRPRNLHTLADMKFAELCNMLRREF
jgi:NitT/TauT family transport system ATP-binding protein